MNSTQTRLKGAPRPHTENTGVNKLSKTTKKLLEILKRRRVLHLDRYGLIDLKEFGLTRRQVFSGLYELINSRQVQIKADKLGNVVLCQSEPIRAIPIPRPAHSPRQTPRFRPHEISEKQIKNLVKSKVQTPANK